MQSHIRNTYAERHHAHTHGHVDDIDANAEFNASDTLGFSYSTRHKLNSALAVIGNTLPHSYTHYTTTNLVHILPRYSIQRMMMLLSGIRHFKTRQLYSN